MKISDISAIPRHHPDCCLSLSSILFDTITQFLASSSSKFVLSVGSGTGLLESLLQQYWLQTGSDLSIEGVEVASNTSRPVNVYLPEEAITTVYGTWHLTPSLQNVNTLMFVYPRDPALVAQYLKNASEISNVLHMVIWLGPKVDWADFAIVFEEASSMFDPAEIVTHNGLAEYEMMTVVRRKHNSFTG